LYFTDDSLLPENQAPRLTPDRPWNAITDGMVARAPRAMN
jgi:hypothetical protein